MKRSFFEKIRLHKSISLLILLLFIIPSLSIAGLQLAGFTFAYTPAKALNNLMHLSKGRSSFGFVSGVGGVAFGGIAKPKGNLEVIGLKYDRQRVDGERLLVTVRNGAGEKNTVVAPVADWVMIPIARFANEDQHAIFTLFGELVNEERNYEWLKKGAKIMNYHPAIENTLLGLRLFQADILAFHPASINLPKSDNNGYLLGTGEYNPNPTKNLIAKKSIDDTYREGRVHSYVINDYEQDIVFDIKSRQNKSEQLMLNGYPLWDCWKLNKKLDEITMEYLQQYLSNYTTEMVSEIKSTAEGMAANGIMITEETLKPVFEKIQIKYAERAMEDTAGLNAFVDNNGHLVNMDSFSRELSDLMRSLEGGNPEVYRALTTAMRYSAFFRYVKEQDKTRYSNFVASIADVSIWPTVRTPTVMIPPEGQNEIKH